MDADSISAEVSARLCSTTNDRLSSTCARCLLLCVLYSCNRTFMVLGGVDAAGNFTASVETLDVEAAQPAW